MARRKLDFDPLARIHIAQLELRYEISPTAARRKLIAHMWERLESLETLGEIGPPVTEDGLHMLTVLTHTVLYEVTDDAVRILGVVDSRAGGLIRQIVDQWRAP